MSWVTNLFSGGDSIKGTLEGAGTLAKDIRTAITGEISAEKKAELEAQLLNFEGEVLKVRASVIMAEANGQSWLQRSWRPITMLTFLVLVVLDSFALLPFRLAAEAWGLLKIGLGGYIIAKSTERVATTWNQP